MMLFKCSMLIDNRGLGSSDANEIPDYYAPGLSIEIKFALETQKKK
ncbi:hypothetical protein ACFLSQ_01435 [Bacteroidota bacterium]